MRQDVFLVLSLCSWTIISCAVVMWKVLYGSHCCLLLQAVGSSRGIAQTERVINYLEQSDMRAAAHELAIMDVVNVTQEQSSIMSVLDDSIS